MDTSSDMMPIVSLVDEVDQAFAAERDRSANFIARSQVGSVGSSEAQTVMLQIGSGKLGAPGTPSEGVADLAAQALGDSGVRSLGRVLLRAPPDALLVLDVAENGFGDEGACELFAALATEGAAGGALHTLDVSSNRFGARGMDALARFMSVSTSLRSVTVATSNSIGDEGAAIIARTLEPSLSGYSSIESLSMQRGAITNVGASALARSLTGNPFMTSLNLAGNALGATAAAQIGDALAHGACVLQLVTLSNNGIDADGAKALAVGLEACTSLHELHLNGNPIGDRGAEAVAAALRGGAKALEALLIGACGIGADGARALAGAIRSNEVTQR